MTTGDAGKSQAHQRARHSAEFPVGQLGRPPPKAVPWQQSLLQPCGDNHLASPSLGSAIRVFWSREQAFICLCCYAKVARCHLRWPLQAALGTSSMGVPASSLCFEELLVYGMERARASSTTQSSPRRKPFALPATFTCRSRQTGRCLHAEACSCAPTGSKCNRGQNLDREVRHRVLKIAITAPWVGTTASLSPGHRSQRAHLQINGG